MGTRSVTIIMSDNHELCRIYRQFDGYPEGMGLDLAKACNRKLTNGIGAVKCAKNGKQLKGSYRTANGMGELAAQIIVDLKTASPVGNIYLEAPGEKINDWAEYVYRITGHEGDYPTIACSTHSDEDGPSMFNPKTSDTHVFTGKPKDWLAKYGKKAA